AGRAGSEGPAPGPPDPSSPGPPAGGWSRAGVTGESTVVLVFGFAMELSRSGRAPLPSGLRAKTPVARNGRASVAARRVDAPGFSHMIGGSVLDRIAGLRALPVVAGPLL